MKIVDLRCENQEKPVIDGFFYGFSWKCTDERPNQAQAAYRLTISTESDLLYDSGKILSDQSYQIVPEITLESQSTYIWQVTVWNTLQEQAESEPAYFETGIGEWKAQWICHQSNADFFEGAQWIWGREMTRTITLEQLPFCAFFNGSADGEYDLVVNDKIIAKGSEVFKRHHKHAYQMLDIVDYLKKGENKILFKSLKEPLTIGFLGKFTFDYNNENIETIVTDGTWLGAEVIGNYGDAPWGRIKRHAIAPLFRKEFKAEKVKKARLYICAPGYFYVTVNGQPICKPRLASEYSQFDKRAYYHTFDIAPFLTEGENCIGVELGNGYFSYNGDWIDYDLPDNTTVEWGNALPQLLCTLAVEDTQGHNEIHSDTTWQCTDGGLLDNTVWSGNVLDVRKMPEGWDKAGFQCKWAQADTEVTLEMPVYASCTPAVEEIEVLQPLRVTKLKDGSLCYEFSKVTAGLPRITFGSPPNRSVRIFCTEDYTDSGDVLATTGLEGGTAFRPHQTCTYVPDARPNQQFVPKFCYMGLRYIIISGIDVPCKAEAMVLHSNIAVKGGFDCSEELFNIQYKNGINSMLTNFHAIPTDTPIYEKRGWTGDTQLVADTSMMTMELQNFYAKWLQDLADTQDEKSGLVSITCPGPKLCAFTPAWQSVFVILPYQMYKNYGDTAILKKHYEALYQYARSEYNSAKAYHDDCYNNALCDWLSPAGTVPPEGGSLCSLAYIYYVQKMMGEIALALDNTADATAFEKHMVEIKGIINREFYKDGVYTLTGAFRQASNLLPLAFGIAEQTEETLQKLVEDIMAKDNHLDMGFSVKYLLPVLTEMGFHELAYKVATRTTFPSWGYIVTLGATSCWEGWSAKPRSKNHFYLACFNQWLLGNIVGIAPAQPAYKRSCIKPYLPAEMTYAQGYTLTPFGMLSCRWERKNGGEVTYYIEVPFNTSCDVLLSKPPQEGEYAQEGDRYKIRLGSGTYTLKT